MIISTWTRNYQTARIHSFRFSYSIEVVTDTSSENQMFPDSFRTLREAEYALVNAGFEFDDYEENMFSNWDKVLRA